MERNAKRMAQGLLPTLPGALCALLWSRHSPAGESTFEAVLGTLKGETSGLTRFDPFEKTLQEIPEWLTDVLQGDADVVLLWLWLLAFVTAVVLPRDPARAPALNRLSLLAPLSALCAFVLPYQHDWIWPIAGRFPHLALVFSPLLLPRMRERWSAGVSAALAVLTLAHVGISTRAFLHFDREEVRGFADALTNIPEGARVVGLIYENESAYVGFHPFMHYAAYSQADHGGVIGFSFAQTQQSPFFYVAPGGPPNVRLGFGWAPEAAAPHKLAGYFEYALSRGEHTHTRGLQEFYERTYQANGWSLWRRRESVVQGAVPPGER
jgi:hypothetical protein